MIAGATLLYFLCFDDRFSAIRGFYMHTQQILMKNQYVDSSIESRARETNCLAVEREMLSHDIVIEGRII
jgi:hypothetical protein